MRRKNMLALGLSFALGVGTSSTLAYALPLEQEESHQTSASEVGIQKRQLLIQKPLQRKRQRRTARKNLQL